MKNLHSRTRTVFQANIADISLSYLLELMLALGEYRDGLVLVGGWVPYLLLQKYQPKDSAFVHVGSKDIDIAVNPHVIDEPKYARIIDLLEQRGYTQRAGTTFSFIKHVQTSIGEDQIQIDFLGPEYGGTAKTKRHQRIQDDFLLRKARGADVMFEHSIPIELVGKLPNGAESKVQMYIANIVGILTMKGHVIGSRYQEKDAYDIFSLILHYKDGPLSVAEEIKPYASNTLVKEALDSIHDKFRSRDAEGPSWVADFEGAEGEQREQIKTQVYLEVKRFLDAI